MNRFILFLSFLFIVLPVFSQQNIVYEKTLWEQAVQKAKNENKLIFVEVLNADLDDYNSALTSNNNDNISNLYNNSFVNYRLTHNNEKYTYIVNRYKINKFPTYIYIQPNGILNYTISGDLSLQAFESNAQTAIKYKNESKPIAQWDLEYESQKNDKRFVYEYIEKRTILGFDNADIIDQYAKLVPTNDLLKSPIINLLLERNKAINADGALYRIVISNQEKVKKALLNKDSQLEQILLNCADYTFNKACKTKNEKLLESFITAKLALGNPANHEDSVIIQNECRAKFYYTTKQPVLMANFVHIYADMIMKQELKKEEQEETVVVNNINTKGLFPSLLSQSSKPLHQTEQIDIAYSFKLRDAAQYVVEMLSNKAMLNNALIWSQKAIELFDNFSNYETHAYVLYKLGKRREAITTMEKAYAVAPSSSESSLIRENVEAKLIKMKRGERIW